MAKAIKRVGVIFLAVAIICLMAIGVILGVNGAKSETAGSLNLNNEIENVSETSEVEIPPISEEVLLDGGNCTEQAAKWTEAITKSLANDGGNHILVTLTKDWVAPNSGNHNFGEGVGFSNGRIYIPENAVITLDLNGKKIDRALTSAIADGSVIFVEGGKFILKDSQYDSVKIQNAYKSSNKGEVNLADYTTGMITGGYNGNAQYQKPAGGICVLNGYFEMNSGMVYSNQSNQGGGIQITKSTGIINDGVINNNIVIFDNNELGGGVYAYQSNIKVNGGIIHKNIATGNSGDCGGLALTSSTASISGGIFANNECLGASGALGGAVFICGTECTITGGVYEYNKADTGGAIGLWNAQLTMSNAYVASNYSRSNGSINVPSNVQYMHIENTTIINNSSDTHAGGFAARAINISLGPGMQVYGNKLTTGEESNVYISTGVKINITDNLLKAGSHIGITMQAGTGEFTTGYSASGNATAAPATFFFADGTGKSVGRSGDEVLIAESSVVQKKITWQVNGVGEAGNSYAVVPYTGTPYNLTAILNGTAATISPVFGSTLSPVEPGNYSYYVGQHSMNPTFKLVIEEPKSTIAKPINKEYKYLYNDGKLINFVPEGFDSSTMEIAYNMQKSIGKYQAKITLRDAWNTTWVDKTTDSIYIEYEIIPRGIEGKDSSNYSHIYLENGYRKSYEDKYEHLINDKEIATINGNTRYVLGNISAQTSVKAFINNLRNESNKIKLYDNNNTLVYDGIASGGVVADSLNNIFVATGYKVEYYYNNNLYDTMYLSILGDVVADGVINTLDVTLINRLSRGEIALSDLSIEQQLAAMVDNKGKVTSTDGKILLNVIGGNTQTDSYFESNKNITNDYMLLDLSIDSVTGKTYRVGSEITTASLVNKAIIGNIAPKTKASEFKTKLASQLGVDISTIAVYKANRAIANDDDYIGTGYYINYNGNTADKIYLSVLGDLTGDGEVNTMDVTCLNRIISGNVKLNTNEIKDKLTMLSAIIQNKGNLTTADSETLWNYIGGNADMTKYF